MPQYLSTDPNAGEEIEAPGADYLSDDPSAGAPEPIGRTGLANRPAVMRPGEEPPWYEGAWEAARQAIFGDPDREDARAAGVGLQPTTAEMVETGLAGASMVAGSPTAPVAIGRALGKGSVPYVARAGAAAAPYVGRAAAGVAGAGRAVGRAAMRHPLVAPVVAAALPGAMRGDWDQAMMQAAIAVGTSGRGPAGRASTPRARPTPRTSRPTAPAAKAPTTLPATLPADAAPVVRPPLRTSTPPATTPASAPAPRTPARTPSTTPRPDPGRTAAQAHGNLMSFAKSVAEKNPKVGEKIWMQLDEAGNPVRYLTPDQAGAATRRGQSVTWVRNLWNHGE